MMRWYRICGLTLLFLFLTSHSIHAYERDVHYDLAKYLARWAGFSEDEAEQVATADQEIDAKPEFNPLPNLNFCPELRKIAGPASAIVAIPAVCKNDPEFQRMVTAQRAYHFVDNERLQTLRESAFQGRNLKILGHYLHALQDTFAHSLMDYADLPPLDKLVANLGRLPDEKILGHFLYGHSLDKTYERPDLAEQMARYVYAELVRFKGSVNRWNDVEATVVRFVNARDLDKKLRYLSALPLPYPAEMPSQPPQPAGFSDEVLRTPIVPEGVIQTRRSGWLGERHGDYSAKEDRTNVGVSVLAQCGSDIYTFADGKVFDLIDSPFPPSQWDPDGALGYMVILEHPPGTLTKDTSYTLYTHMEGPPLVARGALVAGGKTLIGKVGQTGTSVCHTHFEIRYFASRLSQWNSIGYAPGDQRSSEYFKSNWEDPVAFFKKYPNGVTDPSWLARQEGERLGGTEAAQRPAQQQRVAAQSPGQGQRKEPCKGEKLPKTWEGLFAAVRDDLKPCPKEGDEEKKAAADRLNVEFTRKHGIRESVACEALSRNPFAYEGKVIALSDVVFEQMIAREHGLFGLGSIFAGGCVVAVSGIPHGVFSNQRVEVVLAGRVLGNTEVKIGPATLQVPHLQYVGVHICKEWNCPDFFGPASMRK